MTAEMARQGRGGALDALRFIAAAFVVVYHYAEDAPTPLGQISPLFSSGWLATDFFLMLSGYVLARAYGARIAAGTVSTAAFLGKRLLKLWPAHAAMLALLALIVETARLAHISGGHSAGYDWAYLPAELFLIQAWGLGIPPGWNLPTWSLSALIVCYAAFPIVWRRFAAASGLAAMTAGLAVLFASAGMAAATGLRLADLPLEVGVLRALPLFLFGAALARLGPVSAAFAGASRRAWLAAASLAVAAAALLEPTLGVLVVIGAGIAALGPVTPARPWPLTERAAALAFPLFITHFVSGELYFHLIPRAAAFLPATPATGWVLWAGGFAFALAFAAAFARWVDAPMQAALATWLGRRKAERANEPAAA